MTNELHATFALADWMHAGCTFTPLAASRAAGAQAWVDRGLGKGKELGLFYSDSTLLSYFKQWVKHIVTRTNTITGQRYVDDPTIFAW